MRHKAVLLVLLLTCSVCAVAQHTLQGTVRSEDNKFLEGAVIQLQRDTTLIGVSMTERKGEYRFDNIEKGDYLLYVSAFGHQPIREQLNIISNVQKDFNMTVEGEALLDEVTITADMSQVIIPNATGAVYYLSNHAKGLNNPYEALQEIDRLIIIPTEKKVMLTDGSSPLILINGKRFGGGIDSIDPSLVEEVELIESPSARYIKDGVRSILNIKMHRRVTSYYNANLTARHMLPLMYGITMPYFETGNSKLSFNVSAQHFYFYNDDSTWEGWQRNIGYYKEGSGDKRYNMQNFYSEANLDWLISDKDNFVINASIIVSPSKTSTSGTGSLTDKGSFSLWSQDKGGYYVNSYNLYYRHVFTKSAFLEATGHLNFNGNGTKGHRIEEYNGWTYDDLYDFDNYRYSGGLELDFTTRISGHSLEVGDHLNYLKDRISQKAEGFPAFHHSNYNNYIFANISGRLTKRLTYALSIGLDFMRRKTEGKWFNYVRSVEAASLSYRFNQANSINIRYNLENASPNVAQLNPYNTSTDSLVINIGNPDLLPTRHYNWRLQYRFNKYGWTVSPSVAYNLHTDIVQRTGYTNPKTSIYINTFQNNGRYRMLTASLSIGYQSSKWGGISLSVNNNTNFYEGQCGKNYFTFNANVYGWYKKLSWNGYLSFNPKSYDINSFTKRRGAESELMVTYKISNALSVNAGMRYLLGKLQSKTYMAQGSYNSFNRTINNDRGFRTMIGISYYFDKNSSALQRQKKQLNSTESGINIKE